MAKKKPETKPTGKPMSAALFRACRERLRSTRFPARPMSRAELGGLLGCDEHTIQTYESAGMSWSRPVPPAKAETLLRLLAERGLAVPRITKPKPETGPQAPEVTP